MPFERVGDCLRDTFSSPGVPRTPFADSTFRERIAFTRIAFGRRFAIGGPSHTRRAADAFLLRIRTSKLMFGGTLK